MRRDDLSRWLSTGKQPKPVGNRQAIIINLPGLAVDALEGGWDSPSLRLLAGMSSHDDARDVRDTFLSAVRELGRDLPHRDDAPMGLVNLYSLEIVRGT